MKPNWTLYFVADVGVSGDRSLLETTQAALRGGATAVQLRAKSGSTRELLELGRALLELTRAAAVPLIVNDRADVALALEADGLHVGQDDLPARVVRRRLGPGRLLGVSAGTVAEAKQAQADGADYIGAGDMFGTPSKPDAGSPIGLSGLAAITRAVVIPVVGIGGITEANAASAIEAGAAGVAVISALTRSSNPEDAARRLRKALNLSLRRNV